MKHRRILRAVAGLSLTTAALASPAAAQQIQRIVAFGDSFADTGNAFALGFANPQALAVYPTGRFSGGSNYIDTLSQILGAPVQNFAIGGAMGGTNNGTLCFDATYGAPLCGKGLQYEIDQFLNVGTQSNVFPNASTSFTRNDLLAVSIGGNDARVYQQMNPSSTVAAAGTAGSAAAAATGVQLNRLVAQGSPTISFLALNGALAPEVANDPTAKAIRGAYSTAYFNGIQPVLANYAANGAIVHYFDGSVLAAQVAANPGAYGFTNGLVCPIFPNTTCLVSSNGYLFYGDGLHLTSQGFALVGQYIARQLAAPLTLQAPSDMGLDTAQQWGRTLASRADLYGRAAGPQGLRLYAAGDLLQHDVGATATNSAFEVHSAGATLGAEVGLPGGMVGIAGNYSRPKVNFGNDASRVRGRTLQVGAYGSLSMGGLFGEAYAGYGRDRDRLTRTGVVSDLTATAHGNHWVAGGKGGYLMSLAVLRLGPIVAVDYARAKVNGYSENGDAALALNVGGQSYKALRGQAGIEVRGDLLGLHPFADLTAEHDFSGDDRLITFAQTDAPVIVNSWKVNGRQETHGRLSGGASASLVGGFSVDASASTTLGRHHGQEVSAALGLKAAF